MITKQEAAELAREPRWFATIRRAAFVGNWSTKVDFTNKHEADQVQTELRNLGFDVRMKTTTEFYNSVYSLHISWNE